MSNKQKKPKKQQKTVWEEVTTDEKDFYFSFLEKKCRNLNKKLKEIDRLEQDLKELKELKKEQLDKINSKEEVLEKIQYYEDLARVWIEAYKDSKTNNARRDRKLVKQVEILLSQLNNPETQISKLLQANNKSTKDISFQVAELVEQLQEMDKDTQWRGFILKEAQGQQDFQKGQEQQNETYSHLTFNIL